MNIPDGWAKNPGVVACKKGPWWPGAHGRGYHPSRDAGTSHGNQRHGATAVSTHLILSLPSLATWIGKIFLFLLKLVEELLSVIGCANKQWMFGSFLQWKFVRSDAWRMTHREYSTHCSNWCYKKLKYCCANREKHVRISWLKWNFFANGMRTSHYVQKIFCPSFEAKKGQKYVSWTLFKWAQR